MIGSFPLPQVPNVSNAGGCAGHSAPTRCEARCQQHGACNEAYQRCDCPLHMRGSDCSLRKPTPHGSPHLFDKDAVCLSDCNQRGQCLDGWCHCFPGFFGADCSLVVSQQVRLARPMFSPWVRGEVGHLLRSRRFTTHRPFSLSLPR